MEIKYYIVSMIKRGNNSQISTFCIKLKNKIETSEDIENLKTYIKKTMNCDNVIILNWKELNG